jgi:hypothetical protein
VGGPLAALLDAYHERRRRWGRRLNPATRPDRRRPTVGIDRQTGPQRGAEGTNSGRATAVGSIY